MRVQAFNHILSVRMAADTSQEPRSNKEGRVKSGEFKSFVSIIRHEAARAKQSARNQISENQRRGKLLQRPGHQLTRVIQEKRGL